MDTDGATTSAGDEQASCGAKIRTESAGERKIDMRVNPPPRRVQNHVVGRPGTAKRIPLACMCLEYVASGAGVAAFDRGDGLVAKLLDCLNEKSVSRAVHLVPGDCETGGGFDEANSTRFGGGRPD
jgi:hypothetical protein